MCGSFSCCNILEKVTYEVTLCVLLPLIVDHFSTVLLFSHVSDAEALDLSQTLGAYVVRIMRFSEWGGGI
jgi:hypothetical protein